MAENDYITVSRVFISINYYYNAFSKPAVLMQQMNSSINPNRAE
ncbi:hypothetical protein KIS4809_3773 [Bacillus sp. ZZV12-4809]|nr:hypothetical protein [Cytobacillus sp. AMY 15.2]KAF0817508.1 hypothetical protein KIS4809_3773 [Bacillus sp. ZZV12-4809]